MSHQSSAASVAGLIQFAVLFGIFCGTVIVTPPSALAASAAGEAETLSAMDLFEMEYASDPRISPDGKTVAYVRTYSDIMSDRRYSNLWTVDFDGTNHRALTTGHTHDRSPRWSPDGTRLAFMSDRDGPPQIYVRWMDSGLITRITNKPTPPGTPSWSPDGRQLAFTAKVPEAPRSIAKMPPAPKGAKWAPPARIIDKLTYRFNGPGYLKPGYRHVFVIPADGGTPRQISTGNYNHGGGSTARAVPVWTADGSAILISVNRREEPGDEPMDTEIYRISVTDGEVQALTDRRGPDYSPVISPDGKQIAYLGFEDRYVGYQIARLSVMNRDGSRSRILTGDLDRSVQMPRWSEDGRRIYFTYSDRGNTRLGAVTLKGKLETVAGNLGSGPRASAGRAAYTTGAGDRFAMTYTTPNIPGDVAVGRRSGDVRRITFLNDDLLGHKKLADIEEIRYSSSKDGREIQGWIMKPPDFDPNEKYPMILVIHGGPYGDYGDRFDVEKQLMAARGYVVLYVNPRGSTSYGAEFANLIQHAFPGDDFFDLDSGVDAVLERGYVDPNRLYVAGGSAGGTLTGWMIGRTDRFRAAAVLYPVVNWYSQVLTTDSSNIVIKYWFPGLPWDHTEHYYNRSLLSIVDKVKTPTMVLTGENDYRTPISESEQYYTALKLLKVDTVFVRVPGEAHGAAGRPSHHVSKMLHLLGWLAAHGGE